MLLKLLANICNKTQNIGEDKEKIENIIFVNDIPSKLKEEAEAKKEK